MTLAAYCGFHQGLHCLLRANAAVNQIDGHERTALHLAVERGDEKSTKMLLQYHADVSIRIRDSGFDALQIAVSRNSPNLVHQLLDAGAGIEALNPLSRRSTLFLAVYDGHSVMAHTV